jgi:hypothetical protein
VQWVSFDGGNKFLQGKKAGCLCVYVCVCVRGYVWHVSSILKMEPTGFCSMSVHFYQTMWHHILEESNLDTEL